MCARSVGGSYGVGVHDPPTLKTCMINCRLAAIIRPQNVNPYFLAAYLSSSTGQAQIARRVRGAVQQGLILPDLRELPIPATNDQFVKKIELLIIHSQQKRSESENLYAQAQSLLTAELGLDKLDLPEEGIATRRFSEVAAVSRIDAEYFHPQKAFILGRLGKLSGKPIADYFDSIRDVYMPPKDDTGISILNFDLTDALRHYVDEAGPIVPEVEIGSMKKRIQRHDVIVSRLRSYLKEIAVVDIPTDVDCVGSSEFIVLRQRSTEVHPELLATYLRSEPVQTVLKWSQDGANHPRFQEDELLRIKLPDRVLQAQNDIRNLFQSSITAHRDAQRLLAEAKAEVERLIEGK